MSALDAFLPLEEETALWPSELPDHLSATQITMAQRCPEQFRRRYLLGEKERPGAALIWGSADHFAHEQNFAQKIASGVDIPVSDVQVAFAEGFDQAVDRNGGEGEVVWGSDKPGELKDAGTRLVTVYHEHVSPSVQPVAVEEKFDLRIPGVPVPVIGFIDVQTDTHAIERKTSARAVKEIKPQWRLQGRLYQLVKKQPVAWHVSVKTKTPAVYTPMEMPGLSLAVEGSVMAATEMMVASVAQTLRLFFREFGPDQPWPGATSHDWACGWCGYKATCAWWGNA